MGKALDHRGECRTAGTSTGDNSIIECLFIICAQPNLTERPVCEFRVMRLFRAIGFYSIYYFARRTLQVM